MEKELKKDELIELIENLGVSKKGAEIYLANLELGESTIEQLSKHSGIKRTTIYSLVDELEEEGVIIQTKRNKKVYYIPSPPRHLLRLKRRKLDRFADAIEKIESQQHKVFNKPRIYFLYGPNGFKQIWDMVLQPGIKEYLLITDAFSFEDYVSSKYLQEEILKKKKKLGIKSKQLLSISPRANEIIERDQKENRSTKIFPYSDNMEFTELITDNFVAFISPRIDNFLFVVESKSFADSRKVLFNSIWSEIHGK